jgi:cytochrome c-type biogenesis protein CcmH/NrfG
MISTKLKKFFAILKLISEQKNPSLRRKLLQKYANNKDFFLAIKELAVNCLDGNIKLTKYTKKQLQRHRAFIRSLASHKATKNRSKLVTQSGGILPFLIPAAATTLGALLKDVIF